MKHLALAVLVFLAACSDVSGPEPVYTFQGDAAPELDAGQPEPQDAAPELDAGQPVDLGTDAHRPALDAGGCPALDVSGAYAVRELVSCTGTPVVPILERDGCGYTFNPSPSFRGSCDMDLAGVLACTVWANDGEHACTFTPVLSGAVVLGFNVACGPCLFFAQRVA